MTDLRLTILVTSLLIVFFIGLMVLLLGINHTRRIKHRAELIEMKVARDREVMQAEREAQQQTLREVGRELHDNLGQLLTVAQMGLDHVMEDAIQDRRIDEVMRTLELSIDEVRRMGRTLNSDMWVQRSFSEAIDLECARIERAGLARVHLVVEGEPPNLSPDAKTILFRIFQEVVNNALKHARADTLDISLVAGPFQLLIADNGRGFTPAPAAEEHGSTGSGLINIRRRAELIGFNAALFTAPGQGTRWHFTQRSDPHAA